MKLLLKLMLIFLVIETSCAQSNMSSADDILMNFIEKSGGFDNWGRLENIQFDYIEYYEDNVMNKTQKSGIYRNNPVCYLTKGEKSEDYLYIENSVFYKQGKEKWISLKTSWMGLGIRRTFDYQEINPTLHMYKYYSNLAKISSSLTSKFEKSDISFGSKYDVLQRTLSYRNIMGEDTERDEIYLFSKNDGLLRYSLNMERDNVIQIISYSDYQKFDDYLFPTSKVLNPNNTDIMRNEKYNHQFRNEVDGIRKPKHYNYSNIKINQPIDESVFDMD